MEKYLEQAIIEIKNQFSCMTCDEVTLCEYRQRELVDFIREYYKQKYDIEFAPDSNGQYTTTLSLLIEVIGNALENIKT